MIFVVEAAREILNEKSAKVQIEFLILHQDGVFRGLRLLLAA